MTYKIKIDVFEGPFDLLLHLVKINEMDIYDIQVSKIATQYLEYINEMEKLDLDIAGDFLVMAATLVNIKVRSLLPAAPFEEGEEEDIDEYLSSKELIRQLIEYRRFKDLAKALSEYEEQQLSVYYRKNVINPYLESAAEGKPLRGDLQCLLDSFSRVLWYASQENVQHIIEDIYTVEDKISYIESLLLMNDILSVYELFRKCFSKIEMVVTFLAILELCRIRRITLQQERMFEDIKICRWKEEEVSVG